MKKESPCIGCKDWKKCMLNGMPLRPVDKITCERVKKWYEYSKRYRDNEGAR